ncbi:hypothetical protein FisN_13Lh314 [Fistulifera solaris]|uniref:Choline transporter-like protein n=1 Tax=Fistulifera solaris TaxID=1519565 RepID=A0A1Z5KMH3_FISSO|nr:hypothetical protein FisN_13Lh314 [Fistulifera solaris]|eukprot:GAX27138.1 hypothetical protein FisN_13Lh314 [Fistulifera solaris]
MSSDPELQEPLIEPVVVVEDTSVLVEETGAEASFETNENDGVGHEQPAVYRDVLFAILFYVQVVLMLGTAVWSFHYLWKQDEPDTMAPTFAPTAAPIPQRMEEQAEWMFPSDKEERQIVAWTLGFLFLSLACAMVSVALVLVALQHYSHTAVQISFGIAPISSVLVAILMTFVNPHACAPFWITAVLVALLSAIHYFVVRQYIPFTAANLQIGLQAIDATKSLFVYAALLQVMTMVYWIVAATALSGIVVYYHNQDVPCGDDDSAEPCHNSIPLWMALLWLLAVYWTQSVVQNVIRATTAGAVGTWWFRSPDEEVDEDSSGSCCCCICCTGQQDVHDAWLRATTYSFGSICFGSLVVALIQVLERVVAEARRQRQRQHGHDSLWLCLLDCLIESLGRVLEYFNSWAFLYVGIYGYDYMSAGQHVMTLLQQRGFTFLLTHTLLFQVLRYIKGSIGLISGTCLAVVCAVLVQNTTHILWAVFAFGFVAGWMLAGMILFVVESGVRTIMLCFVERPMDAAIHHPAAYQTLTAGWSRVYPEQFPHHSTTTESQAFV